MEELLYTFQSSNLEINIRNLKIMNDQILQEAIVAGKYIVGPCIGAGSFGQVYLVNQIQTQIILALKKEDEKTKYPQLISEARLLKSLAGNKGFAKVLWYGSENKSNMMITEMLGPSLQDLFMMCRKKFSVKTVLMLAIQIIKRLEVLHSKNHIHRDIKPQNFLMGMQEESDTLYMIDFGLSKKYRDSKTRQHISYKEGKSITGTIRFSSINTHLGIEQSRRDDLESVGYLLQYFLFGNLPWQGLQANSKTQKYRKILEMKTNIPIQILFKDMPIEFMTYMNYCRSLKFEDRPDYTFIKKLFRDLLQRLGYEMDYHYDWCNLEDITELGRQNMSINIYDKKKMISNELMIKRGLPNLSSIQIDRNQIQLQVDNKPVEEYRSEIISQGQNIGSDLLQESDMKLISSRNPWMKTQDF